MNINLVGGIAGAVLGLMGGIIGTYFSIKNTNGPKEKSFMIKTCIIGWTGIVSFVVLVFIVRHSYRIYLFIPYVIILPVVIIKGNKIQQKIRKEEAENK